MKPSALLPAGLFLLGAGFGALTHQLLTAPAAAPIGTEADAATVAEATTPRLDPLQPEALIEAAWLAEVGEPEPPSKEAALAPVLEQLEATRQEATDYQRIKSIFRLIDSLQTEDLLPLLASMHEHADELSQMASWILLSRLSMEKPSQTLDFINRQPKQRQIQMVTQLFGTWGALEPETALAKAQQLQAPLQKQMALHSLLIGLAKVDPQQAYQWSKQYQGDLKDDWGMSNIFGEWAKKDAQAAYNELMALPVNKQMDYANTFITAIAQRDPEVALSYAKAFSKGSPRRSAIASALHQMAFRDPQQAIQAARQIPDQDIDAWTLTSIYNSWVLEDPQTACAHALEHAPLGHLADIIPSLMSQWALESPSDALDYAETLSGDMKNQSVDLILNAWAVSDLPAALAYAQRLPQGPQQQNALKQITVQLFETDPERALELLETQFDQKTFDAIVHDVDSLIKRHDPKLLLQLGSKMSQGWEKEHTMSEAIQALARQDMSAAFAYVEALPAGSQKQDLYKKTFEAYLKKDPLAAAEFISTQANAQTRDLLTESVVDELAAINPEAAYNWVLTLPVGPGRSEGTSAALEQLAALNPQTAWQQALTHLGEIDGNIIITDFASELSETHPAIVAEDLPDLPEDLQTDMIGPLAVDYFAADLDAAIQWLSALPEGNLKNSAKASVASHRNTDPRIAFELSAELADSNDRTPNLDRSFNRLIETYPTEAEQILIELETLTDQEFERYAEALKARLEATTKVVSPLAF
jgi:hypothetical protein